MAKKRGLGRPLEALLTKPSSLLSNTSLLENEIDLETSNINHSEKLAFLPHDQIQRGKYQPRREINPDTLQELAESIRVQGIIQPIVVRRVSNNKFEIIAGERRWRAAQLVGLQEIPAIIRDIPDEAAIAMALIENIQREDLNPIEEATALQRLLDEFDMTHQQVAEAVGKSRTSITNILRLLSLNKEVKALLQSGQIEMGHARALLSLPTAVQFEAAKTVLHQGLSVRQTEKLVQHLQAPQKEKEKDKKPLDPDVRKLQERLMNSLKLRVNVESANNGSGKIVIHYRNIIELDHLLALLPP